MSTSQKVNAGITPVVTDEDKLPVEPIHIFDDLFFVGHKKEGVYILKTSEGLVLMEAMATTTAWEDYLKPGLEKLGLDKEKVLMLLITHGHFDHYLGAEHIRLALGCPVGMSKEDTAYMVWCEENSGANKPQLIPRVSRYLEDGEDLVFGDHSVHIMSAPGHTPGCLNFCFDVHDRGELHHAVMMGGFGIFGPGRYPEVPYPYPFQWAIDQALAYTSSCVKLWEYCKEKKADVYFNPHPHLCDLLQHAEANKTRGEIDPNAFVIGTEGVRTWVVDRYDASLESVNFFSDIRREYKEN